MTSSSPSTPGSAYSNPYTYGPSFGNNFHNGMSTPVMGRKQMHYLTSPQSVGSSLCGRAIRGSPAYRYTINTPELFFIVAKNQNNINFITFILVIVEAQRRSAPGKCATATAPDRIHQRILRPAVSAVGMGP